MSYPLRNCHRCGKDFFSSYREQICPGCLHELGWEPTPYSNADHIRYMTDEELAKWLVLRTVYAESAWSAPSYLNFKTCADDTFDGALKGTSEWLKQPYKEEA